MQRNIKLFPIYKMFSYDILFYYAISILYLNGAKGFSLSQVALVSSVYCIVAIFSQIPASIIAGRIGLKNAMIIGNISCIIWGILYILSTRFEFILLAELFCGVGFSLKGVSESPILYSSLKKVNNVSEFAKIESKGSTLYFIIEAIACIVSGILYSINCYLPIIFATICLSLATLFAFCMKDVRNLSEENESFSERLNDLKFGFTFILKSKRLHALLLFASLFYGVIALANVYMKTFFNDIQISSMTFGYIFAFAAVASALGSAIQDKIEKKHKNKTLSVISILYTSTLVIIGVIAILFKNFTVLLYIGTIIYLIQALFKGAYRIIIKEYINRYTTSKIRPKLMSIYYLVENLGAAILTYIASITIDTVPISISLAISGLIVFALLILILNYMNSRVGLNPEKYTKRDRSDLNDNA